MTGHTGLTFTAEPEIAALLNDLLRVPPWERIYAGGQMNLQLRSAMAAVTEVRRAAIREMRAEGVPWADIAEMSGCSRQRLHDILYKGQGKVKKAAASLPADDQETQ